MEDRLSPLDMATKVGLKFTVALTVEPMDSLTKTLIVVLSFKSVLVPLLRSVKNNFWRFSWVKGGFSHHA